MYIGVIGRHSIILVMILASFRNFKMGIVLNNMTVDMETRSLGMILISFFIIGEFRFVSGRPR